MTAFAGKGLEWWTSTLRDSGLSLLSRLELLLTFPTALLPGSHRRVDEVLRWLGDAETVEGGETGTLSFVVHKAELATAALGLSLGSFAAAAREAGLEATTGEAAGGAAAVYSSAAIRRFDVNTTVKDVYFMMQDNKIRQRLNAAVKIAERPFIAAPTFAGARRGFVFRNGSHGTGYYRDDSSSQLSKDRPDWDSLWEAYSILGYNSPWARIPFALLEKLSALVHSYKTKEAIEYEIEAILDVKKASTGELVFLEWKGFDEDENTWSPRTRTGAVRRLHRRQRREGEAAKRRAGGGGWCGGGRRRRRHRHQRTAEFRFASWLLSVGSVEFDTLFDVLARTSRPTRHDYHSRRERDVASAQAGHASRPRAALQITQCRATPPRRGDARSPHALLQCGRAGRRGRRIPVKGAVAAVTGPNPSGSPRSRT